MVSGRAGSEESDLKVGTEVAGTKDEAELLTRTMPTSFVTRTAQDRREALMGKKTRQRYEMEE